MNWRLASIPAWKCARHKNAPVVWMCVCVCVMVVNAPLGGTDWLVVCRRHSVLGSMNGLNPVWRWRRQIVPNHTEWVWTPTCTVHVCSHVVYGWCRCTNMRFYISGDTWLGLLLWDWRNCLHIESFAFKSFFIIGVEHSSGLINITNCMWVCFVSLQMASSKVEWVSGGIRFVI